MHSLISYTEVASLGITGLSRNDLKSQKWILDTGNTTPHYNDGVFICGCMDCEG